MSRVETLTNRVLKKHRFDLEFQQYAWFLASAIKENEFFAGRTSKWIVYVIITELMDRYYGKRNYPILKKDLKETLEIKSPISNHYTSKDKRLIKFRKEFDEMYDALLLKKEIRESNYHEKSKLTK